MKGSAEDLHLQLSTEREVSQRFQLQYEKEASRAKIAAEEFYSKMKDTQANTQHYKQKARNLKGQYEEQIHDLKMQLEAVSAKFKEYYGRSEAKQRELSDKLSRLSSSVPPEERSHQILRSAKALQEKIQELAQEKLEHNATRQQMQGKIPPALLFTFRTERTTIVVHTRTTQERAAINAATQIF